MWKNDFKHGKGIEKLSDGSVYNGTFVNGDKDGHGHYKWGDQTDYNG